jgi:hypothetical protein
VIEGKAYRNAYFALATGAFVVISGAAVSLNPFLTVNLVLLFMVAAELVKLLTQLFYYRKGF